MTRFLAALCAHHRLAWIHSFLDGKGPLSEKNLGQFCSFMLDTALEQVEYIRGLLDMASFRSRIKTYIQARNDLHVRGLGKLDHAAELILYSEFISGKLPRGEALELSGMPERSARRLLAVLKKDGLLSETSSKSPLIWEIPEHAEPWHFPELAPGY